MSDLDEKMTAETPVEEPVRKAPEAVGQADIDAFANQTPVGATRAAKKSAGGGKKSKKWVTWVALAGAVALLAAAVLIVPRLKPPVEDPEPPAPEDTTVVLLDKEVKNADEETPCPVTRVHIASRLDDYTLALGEDNVLRLEGEENLPVNTTAAADLVNTLTYIMAEDTVADHADDLSVYGLTAPTATVEVDYADGTHLTLDLASLAVGSHYYLRMNGEDTVYLMSSSLPGTVMQTAETYVGVNLISAPSVHGEDANGSAVMKELSLTGPVRGNQITTLRRRENTDSGEFSNCAHLLTAPYLMETDTTMATDVFAVTEVNAADVVALHPTEGEKEEYGLDDPQSIAKIVLAVYTYTADEDGNVASGGYYNETPHLVLLGKKDADGNYYAMVDAMDVIFLVEAANVPWAERTYHDFASQYLFLRNLTSLKSLGCTLDGKTYDFEFAHFPEAETLDEQLQVTVDGKQYPTDDFRTLYQVLMTLCRTGAAPAEPQGDPLLTVRITSTDENFSVKTIDIYPYSGSVYIARANTGDTYKVTASNVDDAIVQIRHYLNGEPVVNKW